MKDDNSIEYSASNESLDSAQARDYLIKYANEEVVIAVNDGIKLKRKLLGGLRLLVQEWPKRWTSQEMEDKFSLRSPDDSTRLSKEDSENSPDRFIDWLKHEGSYRILPFNQRTLKLMTNAFRLPPSYPFDLSSEVAVPLRCNWIRCPSDEVTDDEPPINLGEKYNPPPR